ncbi:aminotransferase class I/II-fold pyridoxal phosphate-dependent enzyme [Streptomyces bugieae]|uniref:Aminotransferase class I/II-fold pyridoxal phosphate-dependent enzyme n=1 Tax=Streptomyces bugieae TaxID=3098223 RepID=A0ABU7NJE1_9ACTN|nr:aminotransferase class I/II-fold pyridoxal phosphate-dependent enzyme [Streptomyces sp. DSM 41528]
MSRIHRLMAAYVILVIPPTVVYLTVPAAHTYTWAAIVLGNVWAIIAGIRMHRPAHAWPWLLLAAANLAFMAGDTTYNVLNSFLHQENPFPSLADVFYLATYPLFAAGLLGFIRYRRTGRDVASLLDAMILTSGLALLSWDYLINPYTTAADMTWVQRSISIAYPLGDVLMLAMLARLLTPGSVRTRAVQFLTLGTFGILFSDVLYGLLQLKGAWQVGTPMDLGWVVFFTAWGLAALHPSMVELTERTPVRQAGIHPRRLAVLALASLIAPVLLIQEAVRGQLQQVPVIAVFSAVLFLLVFARLSGLVVVHLRAVTRERGLRVAAAALVSTSGVEEIAHSIRRAAGPLFGSGVSHEVALLTLAPGETRLHSVPTTAQPHTWTVDWQDEPADAWRPRFLARETQIVRVTDLGDQAVAELAPLPSALLCPLAVSNGPAGNSLIGALIVAGTEKSLAERWGSFETLAAQAALAMERVALGQEINRRNSEAYFRTLVHNTSDVILILDDDNTIRYASPSAEGMFGRTPLNGVRLAELMSEPDGERALRALGRMRDGDCQDSRDDWQVLHRDGARIDVEARCSNLRHDQTVHGLVLTLRDVTEQRKLERELTHRAFHDALTGLPNRLLLLERIEHALLRGRRDGTVPCVLFIDLDDFKVVNDTSGHSIGDELLIAVARRLTGTMRASDTAARLGGDEFGVLMEGVREPADAEALGEQVVQNLNQPFRLSEQMVSTSASVGIATARDSADAEELLGHADLALYAAKTAGKRQWRRYQAGLHTGMLERHELRARLEGALDAEAFDVRYQPIVEIATGALAGFEALARWPHARRGSVTPHQFIALAEETGHIMPLGAWVLQQATANLARWQREVPRPDPLHINVNVSARQFRDPGFLDEVRAVLGATGVAHGSLVLELTETVLMHTDEQIRAVMRALKDLGVRMAIDDFGTGFSSLSYLREFPIDLLKVDKSFIDDIGVDTQQVALVEGIVRIADTLGLQVIAEGIEEDVQRDRLLAMGCRFGQGYLYARPMTVDQAEQLLRSTAERRAPALAGSAATSPVSRRTTAPSDPQRTGTRRSGAEEDHVHKALRTTGGARRDPRWGELERLRQTNPMCDAVIDEVDGRHLRSGDHWLIDFASCNYLGFDLDPEIMAAIEPQVRRWGTHPSWSRLIGNPRLYPDIEDRLTALLHAQDSLLLPTITLIHASVIPVLGGEGNIFVEARAHRTVYDGCLVARGQGATVQRFHADRPDELEVLLRSAPPGASRLVCLDGVDSMTGNLPDLPLLAGICRQRDALLYIDDAHGFGVIGERGTDETSPYGSRGNCIVRHLGETYDGIVLVGGFSKAYSSLLAFLALPTWMKNHLKVAAAPYLYSGPSPTASLATALAGLDVNDRRGDTVRAALHRKTARVLDHLYLLGIETPNESGLPIIELPLAHDSDLDDVGLFMWDRGIYVTLAAYPLVPRDRVGIRIQVTAANTDEDIGRLNETISALAERFELRQRT